MRRSPISSTSSLQWAFASRNLTALDGVDYISRRDKTLSTRKSVGLCAILVGGQSRRMGQQPKAFLTLGDRTFLQRIADAARSHVKDVTAIGGAPESFRRFPIRHIPDAWHEAGPLGGIATALASTKRQYVFVVPCDAPLFEGRAITLARDLIGEADAAIFEVEGRLNATIALYKKSSCFAVFRRALELGRFRLLDAVAGLTAVIISERQWREAGISPTAFVSANTPEELAKLIGYYETSKSPA